MTNKEVADYYASLPPDEGATVMILDGDAYTVDTHRLVTISDDETLEKYGFPQDLSEYGEDDRPKPGQPFAFKK